MSNTPSPLSQAIEATCANGVEEVIRARRPEDLELLRAALRQDADVSAAARQNAVHILGRWGDTESAGPIRSLLPRLDERERINAVDALGNLGGTEAEDGVLQLAQDRSPDVRRFATYALANLDTDTSTARLNRMETSDPAERVRTAAARARQGLRGATRPDS